MSNPNDLKLSYIMFNLFLEQCVENGKELIKGSFKSTTEGKQIVFSCVTIYSLPHQNKVINGYSMYVCMIDWFLT